MEETQKRSKYGFLFAVLKVVGIIVAIVAVILIGIYAYIRLALGIDIFGTISTLKKLGSDFEMSAIVDYEYTQTDVEQAFNQFDLAGISNIYTETNGEYAINPDYNGGGVVSSDIAFTDKQLAGFLQTFIKSSVLLEDSDNLALTLNVKQVKFSNYELLANGPKVDVNVVLYTSIKTIKSVMNIFPLSLFVNYIPDDLYVSANFSIQKTGVKTYSISPDHIKLNGLNETETFGLISLITNLMDGGDAYTLCQDIGDIMFQSLICGDGADQAGLTSELSVVGIVDYNFEVIDEKICFVLKKSS